MIKCLAQGAQQIGFGKTQTRKSRFQIAHPTSQPSQHKKEGHHQHASETPFKWRFAGGPFVARYCVLAGEPLYSSA